MLKCSCIMSQLFHTEEWTEISISFSSALGKKMSRLIGPSDLNRNLSVSMILIPFPFKRQKKYFRSLEHAGYTISYCSKHISPFLCVLNEQRQMLKGQLFLNVKMPLTPFCCGSVVKQSSYIQLFRVTFFCFCFYSYIMNQVNVIIDALKCIQCFSCNYDLCFSNSPKIAMTN